MHRLIHALEHLFGWHRKTADRQIDSDARYVVFRCADCGREETKAVLPLPMGRR